MTWQILKHVEKLFRYLHIGVLGWNILDIHFPESRYVENKSGNINTNCQLFGDRYGCPFLPSVRSTNTENKQRNNFNNFFWKLSEIDISVSLTITIQ